ncbi:MAG: gamma-glutamyltransferase family protein, partial [Cyclobacteriaceae bacterium]
MRLVFSLAIVLSAVAGFAQSFNNLPVTTQKPPLHGRHWMAITGKPLAAAAGAMIFTKGGNAVDASCAM